MKPTRTPSKLKEQSQSIYVDLEAQRIQRYVQSRTRREIKTNKKSNTKYSEEYGASRSKSLSKEKFNSRGKSLSKSKSNLKSQKKQGLKPKPKTSMQKNPQKNTSLYKSPSISLFNNQYDPQITQNTVTNHLPINPKSKQKNKSFQNQKLVSKEKEHQQKMKKLCISLLLGYPVKKNQNGEYQKVQVQRKDPKDTLKALAKVAKVNVDSGTILRYNEIGNSEVRQTLKIVNRRADMMMRLVKKGKIIPILLPQKQQPDKKKIAQSHFYNEQEINHCNFSDYYHKGTTLLYQTINKPRLLQGYCPKRNSYKHTPYRFYSAHEYYYKNFDVTKTLIADEAQHDHHVIQSLIYNASLILPEYFEKCNNGFVNDWQAMFKRGWDEYNPMLGVRRLGDIKRQKKNDYDKYLSPKDAEQLVEALILETFQIKERLRLQKKQIQI